MQKHFEHHQSQEAAHADAELIQLAVGLDAFAGGIQFTNPEIHRALREVIDELAHAAQNPEQDRKQTDALLATADALIAKAAEAIDKEQEFKNSEVYKTELLFWQDCQKKLGEIRAYIGENPELDIPEALQQELNLAESYTATELRDLPHSKPQDLANPNYKSRAELTETALIAFAGEFNFSFSA